MKSKGIRRVFRWVAGLVVLAVVVCTAILIFEGRDEGERLPKPEACPVVSNVIETIIHVFAKDGDYVRLDVRKMTCLEFENRLKGVSDAATLWTPGEGDWLVIGVERGCSNTLERVADAFAAESTVFSLPEILANCVGTVADVRPAFSALDPDDRVAPELFVTKEIPNFTWLRRGQVDADITGKLRQEIRSLQVVRRLVLEGDMYSKRQQEKEAVLKWAGACRRAPNDTLLLERIDHLRRNAEVFYKVGKYGMAVKCYETLLGIKPTDYVAAVNLAECLKRLGKRELYEAVLKKAETLRRD